MTFQTVRFQDRLNVLREVHRTHGRRRQWRRRTGRARKSQRDKNQGEQRLHVAHVKFLEEAKKQGDALFVLLESDDNVRKLKVKNRPINNQKNRAIVLSSMTYVDHIVMLPNLKTNDQYDHIVTQIQPSIIATTANDPSIAHKIRQAKQVNGKVVNVLQRIYDQSTSRLARLINQDL